MALTRIPLGPSSSASTLVRWATPVFTKEYRPLPAVGASIVDDDMFTIAPPPAATRWGMAAWQP